MAKRVTYLRKTPDYTQPNKEMLRAIGQDLVAKYLRAKRKGQTVKKIPTGLTAQRSFGWR